MFVGDHPDKVLVLFNDDESIKLLIVVPLADKLPG